MLRAPMSLEKMSYDAETGTVIYRSKMHLGLKRNFQVMPGAEWLELLCRHILDRYKNKPDPLYDKSEKDDTPKKFGPADFDYDPEARTCICPAGKQLYRHGKECVKKGLVFVQFQGTLRDCGRCQLRDQCLRTPEKTKTRQVAFFQGKAPGTPETHTERMKRRIDTPEGRALYAGRFQTVEPVFGNLRHNKQLNRFTLRSRTKTDGQWKLFCLVHNIEKLAHHGYAS